MSFPRAKLQRFNEVYNCTPSPADYNPKIKSRVAGAVISNAERFIEAKSPAVSDISMHSLNSTTCFRTPTLPKKKKQLPSSLTKVKSADIFTEADSSNEALKEKMVECNNKDAYIKELTEQIEEMKTQLSKLHSEKNELEDEKLNFDNFLERLQDEHKVEMENMQMKHRKEEMSLRERIVNTDVKLDLILKEREELQSNNLKNKYEEFINKIKEEHKLEVEKLQIDRANARTALKEQIMEVNNEMTITKKDWDKLRQENRRDIEETLKNISEFQNLNDTLIKTYNEELKVKEEIITRESQVSSDLKQQLNRLKETHKKEIDELQLRHKLEIEDIEYEMLKTITELQNKLESEKKSMESMYKTQISNLENTHKQMEEKIELQTREIAENNRISEGKCICIQNEWKAKLEEQRENLEKVLDDCKELHEFHLTQCKIEQEHLKEEMNEKIQEVENTWKNKLDAQIKESSEILKECQAISEYNIIQCEIEKNDVKNKLADTLDELQKSRQSQEKYLSEKNTIEGSYVQLKATYNEVIAKLESISKELIEEKELHKEEMQKLLAEKHTFDITITKTRKTVEALTKRLFDSDRDVEQLKSELELCEKSKLQVEAKCNVLMQELETTAKLCEDMELQCESNLKQWEVKILDMGKRLTDKVDRYRKKIEDSLTENNREIKLRNEEIGEIRKQLDQQQILNSEAQSLISKVCMELEEYETHNGELEDKISSLSEELESARKKVTETEESNKALREQLQDQIVCSGKVEEKLAEAESKNEEIHTLVKQMNHLQEKSDSYYKYCDYYKCKTMEYEKEIEELNVIQKNYIDQSGKYDELLQKFEALQTKNAELVKTVEAQESLIGPFRDQLEAYELERSALISQKHDAENEARMMGMKYAQILGHQNQKQKIKHLVDLKRKNCELMEIKASLETKLRGHAKTVEKLKKEIASLTKTPKKQSIVDKENVNSPNRSLNNSHVLSPLKERNDILY